MNMNEQMKESEESILHTYNRFPVVFEKGIRNNFQYLGLSR